VTNPIVRTALGRVLVLAESEAGIVLVKAVHAPR
jgi:hypothetical protein